MEENNVPDLPVAEDQLESPAPAPAETDTRVAIRRKLAVWCFFLVFFLLFWGGTCFLYSYYWEQSAQPNKWAYFIITTLEMILFRWLWIRWTPRWLKSKP